MTRWKEVGLGDLIRLEVPRELERLADHPIDSEFGEWAGEGVTVQVDAGPFADPMTSHTDRPEFRSTTEQIDGRRIPVVTFRDHEGWRVMGAQITDTSAPPSELRQPLTIVVRAREDVGPEVQERILRSIKVLRGKERR